MRGRRSCGINWSRSKLWASTVDWLWSLTVRSYYTVRAWSCAIGTWLLHAIRANLVAIGTWLLHSIWSSLLHAIRANLVAIRTRLVPLWSGTVRTSLLTNIMRGKWCLRNAV